MIRVEYSRVSEFDENHVFVRDAGRMEKLRHLSSGMAKNECYTAGLLTESIIPAGKKVCYDSYGKPFFGGSNRSFNISHSGGYVFIAWSDEEEVAIDFIDSSRRADDRVLKRICNDEEYEKIHGSSEVPEDIRAALVFSSKEAVSKFFGKGLSMDFKSFHDMRVFDGSLFTPTEISIDNGEKLSILTIGTKVGMLTVVSDRIPFPEIRISESGVLE